MSTTLVALRALLDEERDALLAGELDRLGALADRKEHLFAGLEGLDPGDDHTRAIRDALVQNAGLLKAAQAGLEAARLMLSGDRPVQTMTVYARDGASRALHNTRPGLQHKV